MPYFYDAENASFKSKEGNCLLQEEFVNYSMTTQNPSFPLVQHSKIHHIVTTMDS